MTVMNDDDSNNNFPNGSEQNHIHFPSTSLRVIEASSTDEENIGNSQRLGKKRRRKSSLWNRNKAKFRTGASFAVRRVYICVPKILNCNFWPARHMHMARSAPSQKKIKIILK